jgi:16S rRNA processing protein RimM
MTSKTRTGAAGRAPGSLVAVGRIAKPQGRFGEVAVDPWTDDPERFGVLDRVFVSDEADRETGSFSIEGFRMHKGRPVLKLVGVSSIGEARTLCGKKLTIPETELLPLAEGSFYTFQLRGLAVADRRSGEIGMVEDLLETGGTDLLVVRQKDGTETLVPLCEEIVRNIDIDGRRIEIDAPEGLVSLNAN